MTTTTATVTVLGLGAMGTAIARTASRRHRVTVWNRSAKADAALDLPAAVTVADSVDDAVSGADIVVVCVIDHDAARAVMAAADLAGPLVVNLTTATPAEATETAASAHRLGLRYVTGAIMVPTTLIGTDDCLVLYAGTEADLAAMKPLEAVLGGTADHTGSDHAVPPALDLAMLDIYFAGLYAHLHATALAAAHGVAATRFLPYAVGIVETLGASLPDLTEAVGRRSYDGGQAGLAMCLSFLDKVVATSRAVGIAPGLAEVVRDASARALERHPAATDWEVVGEVFLRPVPERADPITR